MVVHCLNKSSTIGDLRRLIVGTGEDKYLMTEEYKRPYRADKKLRKDFIEFEFWLFT